MYQVASHPLVNQIPTFHLNKKCHNYCFSPCDYITFVVLLQVIYWDQKAFYVEQSFIRKSDGFVCAVNICKMAVVGGTTEQIFQKLPGAVEPPPITEELQRLIDSWTLNSDRLKKSS